MDWQPKIGDKCTRNPEWITSDSSFIVGKVYTVSKIIDIIGITYIFLAELPGDHHYIIWHFTKVEDDDPIEEI